jgi:fibronectin-binding autotransporter adhesin
MKKNQTKILLAAILALGASLPVLHAQTWDGGGGTNRNWGTAANWNLDTAPNFAGTPNLTFSGSGTAYNESSGRTLGSITFDGSQSFTLSGSQFALNGNINFRSSTSTPPTGVTPTGTHAISSDIILNGATTVSHPVPLNLSGVISGAGSIVKGGIGMMNLSNANTFAGGVQLNNGSMTISHKEALGTGALQFANNATPALQLNLSNAGAVANAIQLSGPDGGFGAKILNINSLGVTMSGTMQNMSRTSKTVELSSTTDTSNTYDGIIGGGGTGTLNITKSGSGTWTLTKANTYSGNTSVTEGTLATGGNTASFGTGNITVGNLGTLFLDNAVSIGDTASLTFGSTSKIILDFTGTERIGSLASSFVSTFINSGTYSAEELNLHFFGTNLGVFSGTGSLNVVSAIPEPSTFAGLAGLAALALGMGSRRRTKRTALTN